MRRSCSLYGVFAAALLALLADASPAFAGTLYPKIVVTVPALAPYADALLDGIGRSQSLLRPGQDAHDFSISASQREMLSKADIIVLSERSMAPQLEKLLAGEAKRGADIVELSHMPGADPLPYATQNAWLDTLKEEMAKKKSKKDKAAEEEDETKDKDGKTLTDPHLWMDPIRMADLAAPLAEIMIQKSPGNREALRGNARKLAEHLRQDVAPGVQAILKNASITAPMGSKPEYPFITYHAGYQYFMARFGLTNPGEITQRPEDFFGARSLQQLMTQANRVHINCVISEMESPLVRRVAVASGAKIIALSPEAAVPQSEVHSAPWAQNDYDRLLQKTAESFAGCMK